MWTLFQISMYHLVNIPILHILLILHILRILYISLILLILIIIIIIVSSKAMSLQLLIYLTHALPPTEPNA